MSGFDYFKDVVLNNYANFNGRARRKEYWYFTLFNLILVYGLLGLGMMISPEVSTILMGVVALALLIPGIAVLVRRLHDVGKSGWMYFVVLIPLAGFIWLLVLLTKDSDSGTNQYGPNPKDGEADRMIHDNLV